MEGVKVYPIVLIPEDEGFSVYVPDFDINTQGQDLAEAIYMARDAIGLVGLDYEDEGKKLPEPNSKTVELKKGEIKSLVDIDLKKYRQRLENKSVKKNCTIPFLLNEQAERAGINFSKVLQDALKTELSLE